jgi:hypothetical protein
MAATAQPALALSLASSSAPVAAQYRLSAKTASKSAVAEGQATEPRTPAAVQISVATRREVTPLAATLPVEPAAADTPKTLRGAGQPRVEIPVVQASPSASVPASQPDAVPAPMVQVGNAPAATPSSTDITAALDRLVAAREALLPAETSLAIDHAEFGQVTIRFEQSTDGRISAELGAADPDLQRAVTAAVATERGFASGGDSDGGRSAANSRGSFGSSGEAAPGERGQRSNDQDVNQRRKPGAQHAEPGAGDPHPGTFA